MKSVKVLLLNMFKVLDYQGFLSAWGEDLLRFAVPWGTEEIAGFWFAKGGQCPS